MIKSVGNTVFGVNIGCHALSRCCLKAVSRCQQSIWAEASESVVKWKRTCRFAPTPFLFLWLVVSVVVAVSPPAVSSEETHYRTKWKRG
jgi:hypothetical protein